jgi:Amt family ammonium transporter
MSELSIAELTAKVTALEVTVTANTGTLSTLPGSVDTFYYLFVGSLVFFMQAGFGLLEAGSVRTKNTKNILLKNLLDACIGAIVWWAWGYAAAVKLPLLRPARTRRRLLHKTHPRAASMNPPAYH